MFKRIKYFMKNLLPKGGKVLAVACAVTVLTLTMAVPVFAADPAEIAITAAMLEPVLGAVMANLAVILPIGVGLFAIMLGVRIIPRIFRAFIG